MLGQDAPSGLAQRLFAGQPARRLPAVMVVAVEPARPPQRAKVPHRVPGAQKVAPGAHLSDRLQGQRLAADLKARHRAPAQPDDLVGQEQHLIGAGQPRLEIAAVVDQVVAGQGRDGHPQGPFGRGLYVGALGVAAAGEAPHGQVL